MAASDALPLPRKNVAFRLYFTARTSAGVLVTAFTAPDSEVSKDGGAYADCTNEATFVGHGQGYVDLTSTEMNADNVAFFFSCTEGEIESPIIIYPAEDADIKTNIVQCNGNAVAAGAIPNVAAGATGGLPVAQLVTTIATLASQGSFTLTDGPPDDDALNDMALLIRDASTAGQFTVGIVVDYVGSTKTVTFGTASKFGTKFTVAVGDSVTMLGVYPLTSTVAARALDVTGTGGAGVDWSNVESQASSVALSQTSVSSVSGSVNTVTNAVTVGTINPNVIGATQLAADASTEIAAAVRTNLTTELGYLTGDAYVRLGAPAGASIAADIETISTKIGTPVNGDLSGDLLGIDNKLGSPAGVSVSADVAAVKGETASLIARLGAWTGTGVNTLLGAFKALLSKVASTPSDIGGTFDPAADSTEAVSEAVALVKVDTAATLGQTGTTGVLLADSEDVYPADIQFTRDDDNDKDEYTVLWFRNGTPVTSGITVPLIQVVKRADGTDLIASTAMTQIGSTGAYKYDESTAASRVADGEAVIVICTATINGSARSWRKTVTRDDTN